MTTSLITLNLSDVQLEAMDAALSALEHLCTELISLAPEQKRKTLPMGDKSEAFCRQTLSIIEQNPTIMPQNMDVNDALGDLAALDQLRPRLQRITRLHERFSDTDFALRSDVMSAALQGYAQLKLSGRSAGLESLRKDLSMRFAKTPKQPKDKAA